MEPHLTLERFAYLDHATIGKILELDIFTLERPWLNNQRNISCIPEAIYKVKPDQEGRYTGFPELQDVPNRTEIIIHSANAVSELEGCIAPGMTCTYDHTTAGVWNSVKALKQIMAKGDQFILTVTHKEGVLWQ